VTLQASSAAATKDAFIDSLQRCALFDAGGFASLGATRGELGVSSKQGDV